MNFGDALAALKAGDLSSWERFEFLPSVAQRAVLSEIERRVL